MRWGMISLAKVIKLFEETFGEKPYLITSAPGRADFLNTHQDYKGLPVVPVALDLRAYIAFKPRQDFKAVVMSWNLKEMGETYRDEFDLKEEIDLVGGKWFGDYFRAVTKVLMSCIKCTKGFDALIISEVPVASGLASSAAIEVAFGKGLATLWNISLSVNELAELCYIAEHDVLKIPCGRLDQYGSAYGGIIVLYPKPPVKVEKVRVRNLVFTIVDSGIRHSTAEIHPKRQAELNKGLQELLALDLPESLKSKLRDNYWETLWDKIDLKEIEPYLNKINTISAKRILFTIKMNESTINALNIIKSSYIDSCTRLMKLGEVMNVQHELLRDLYDVSLPELEKIRDSMLKAGAYGVKISGAGLGGALIALVKDVESGKRILEAGLKAGAKKGWVAKIDEGVKVEYRC